MQQTDKHGRIQDEALKHEAQELVRSTDVQEWADTEFVADDQPIVGTDPSSATIVGTPPGMTPREVEERSLLARHLGASVYPATRDALLEKLQESNAPDRFLARVESLPTGVEFENVRDVAEHLGLHVETQRT